MRFALCLPLLAATWAAMPGCARPAEQVREGSADVILAPLPETAHRVIRLRQVVYVPVYSSIYSGYDRQMTDLAATLSIRNTSTAHPIVVHSATYYDSNGNKVREYVNRPGSLAPMATADFVIQRRDRSGGPGANFLVEWSSSEDVDEPVIEAVMVGQHGNAGISFSSAGRVLPKASARPR